MKLLFLASSSIHSIKWIKYFKKAGFEVAWATFDTIDSKLRQEMGLEVIELGGSKSKLWNFARAAVKIRAVVRETKPDLIHVHYIGFYGLLALLQDKAPIVSTAWGSDILTNRNNIAKKRLVQRVLEKSLMVTTDADHMIEAMVDLGADRKKIKRINFGIDTVDFTPDLGQRRELQKSYELNDAFPVILSTRNHYDVYDIATIVKSIPLLEKKHPSVKLLVAGRGPETENLKALVQELNIAERVSFLGGYNMKQLKEFLTVSDVYVSASLSDAGIAASTAEAMAMKLPVVVSDVCENREWICEPYQLFRASDSEDLVTKIETLFSEKEKLANLGERERRIIQDKNDYNNEMAKMAKFYFEVLPKSSTTTLPISSRDRVVTLDRLAAIVEQVKSEGRTVVQCHGCFDVLHAGHLRHFESARKAADVLIATITPDEFINKGPNRPVFPAKQRAELIAGLGAVSWVAINKWPSAVPTIEMLKPNYFAKGDEYEAPDQQVNPNFQLEKQAVEKAGGCVYFTREWTTSSSKAIERMRIGVTP
ncbi:MAG: hypothetical protein COT74_11180 [Bdellovibrionales bacterium CG10_big_fil_rev_8_21_14_0_10_45_34]|nr:MAG: hypothetical protein COT74_11180 [Bdellovibrionales bacterium CG10_big_fil_rev_8_21_14_0_10_45_34]